MSFRLTKIACIAAAVVSLGSIASASTLTNGFTIGVTEGDGENRRTVDGTVDLTFDSISSSTVVFTDALKGGDIFGIYGRIIGATDFYEFEFTSKGAFEIAFDLDGYDVCLTSACTTTAFQSVSGLVDQADVPGESHGTTGGGGKEVEFSLSKDGGPFISTLRTSNILAGASPSERVLFTSSEAGTFTFRVDGLGSKVPALYDINITGTTVPLPAGAVLMITGLAGLGFMRRRRKAA